MQAYNCAEHINISKKIQNLYHWIELFKLRIYKFESPQTELRIKSYGSAKNSYLLPTLEKKLNWAGSDWAGLVAHFRRVHLRLRKA